MNITHPFVKDAKNIAKSILENKDGKLVTKISTVISRLSRNARQIEAVPPEQENPFYVISGIKKDGDKVIRNAGYLYEGYGFEFIVDAMMTEFESDDRIRIPSSVPLSKSVTEDDWSDVGNDRLGIGVNGKPAVVQIKKRRFDYKLSADRDHLYNTIGSAYIHYNVDPQDNDNILIITSGDSVFYKNMDSLWRGKVRYIGYSKSWGCVKGGENPSQLFSLKTLLDDNISFWKKLRDQVP